MYVPYEAFGEEKPPKDGILEAHAAKCHTHTYYIEILLFLFSLNVLIILIPLPACFIFIVVFTDIHITYPDRHMAISVCLWSIWIMGVLQES